MKFKIIGRRYDVTDKIRDYVEKKLGKLDKFFKDESEARVVIGTIKDNDYIEATIYAAGMMYRAEASDKEILAAIDKIVDVIERQIRKNKTRLNRNVKDNIKEFNFDFDIKEEEEPKEKIVKRKTMDTKPMSEEEAILQMSMLGHEFFIYKDSSNGNVCVLYKRKDGNLGIIETK